MVKIFMVLKTQQCPKVSHTEVFIIWNLPDANDLWQIRDQGLDIHKRIVSAIKDGDRGRNLVGWKWVWAMTPG